MAMKYNHVEGIAKPVSQVVMGYAALRPEDMGLTCAMLECYCSAGGNCLDTAWIYAQGKAEQAIGKWFELWGNREQMVVIDKGAHTPHNNPQVIRTQLRESLERLNTDYVDVYFLHRDNPGIPVSEFMDALDEQYHAGLIRAAGASNWTMSRIDQANAYAKANGRIAFSAVSNNLALAQWNEPMWPGCLSSAGLEWRKWLIQSGISLVAWSSQASGFFTGRYGEADRKDPAMKEIVRTWFNAENFERMQRVRKLAEEKGCTTAAMALAWVLAQEFACHAVIGPNTVEEARSSMEALDVELTESQRAWLNLERETVDY